MMVGSFAPVWWIYVGLLKVGICRHPVYHPDPEIEDEQQDDEQRGPG